MAGFTGSFIQEPTATGIITHACRIHDPKALCGANVHTKNPDFSVTSPEPGSFVRTLLKQKESPCPACLAATDQL
jgi:hypothetical protein